MPDADRLYRLLPAYYRELDAEKDHALRALLRLIGGQADLLRGDIEQLGNDFFIETCQRWAIPYIGALVANDLLHDIDLAGAAQTAESLFPDLAGPNLRPGAAVRTRADVAKTIYYRRRKGTPPMLEELARDVAGWPAHVVEFFERLTWTQNLNHLRPHSVHTADQRDVEASDRVPGPFSPASHTVDVRRIDSSEGWYNIRNVGFFLWRLRRYPLRNVTPRAILNLDWRYTFSPLGHSAPLFTAARREADETGLAGELHVPGAIRPAAFFEDLKRAQTAPQPPASTAYYGDPQTTGASFVVFDGGLPVPAHEIACANLENWVSISRPEGSAIWVDVRRGRLIVGKGRSTPNLTVAYSYGFSADLGGGPYDRRKWLVRSSAAAQLFTVGVGGTHATLDNALLDWSVASQHDTFITIVDDATYEWGAAIALHETGKLTIQARSGARPCIRPAGGSIRVNGTSSGSELTLNGLLIEGGIEIDQDIERLRLLHCTLVPGRSIAEEVEHPEGGVGIRASGGDDARPINAGLRVEIAFSITGPLRLPEHAAGLWLLDSIIDGSEQTGHPRVAAIAGERNGSAAPVASIERCTIFGSSSFLELPMASDTIFTAPVTVTRRQDGCVRFSFVPEGSMTPRRHRCQPNLAIDAEVASARARAEASGSAWNAASEQDLIERLVRRMVPSFEAEAYGQPAYAQLRRAVPIEIRAGASDGAEMGAFNHLKQPQREANLRIRLDEYLPVGLDAGFLWVT